jgi:hypothetical protein
MAFSEPLRIETEPNPPDVQLLIDRIIYFI